MNDETAQKLSLGTLIASGERYRIPEYQRNYAWTGTEIRQLIEDVRLAHNGGRPRYFLGNIVTMQAQDGVYEVVDGQQRLTTLMLLISALRVSLGTPGGFFPDHSQTLAFASRARATTALQRVATSTTHDSALDALGGSIRDDDDATEAARRGAVQGTYTGYSIMRAELAKTEFESDGGLEGYLEYLLKQVEVIRVTLPRGTDLNRYFEVINTRGKQLDPTDIVRAQLMSALSDNQAELRTFQRIWDACAQMDGFVQIALTPGDLARRTALFGRSWRWLTPSSFEELTRHLPPTGTEYNTAPAT